MSLHDRHRERLRERFLKEGLDNFAEHQVLEMLLFYCLPRIDTNAVAHELLNRFGSLSSVLQASPSELQKVKGIGPNAACFISFAAAFSRYYMINRAGADGACLLTVESWSKRLEPYFLGKTNEMVFLLCLDAKGKQLACKLISEGSVNSAGIQIRKVVEAALNMNASFAVLAHNHPSGLAIPSGDDVATTKMVADALHSVDVGLLDHIIFADDDSVSLAQSGYFAPRVSYRTI